MRIRNTFEYKDWAIVTGATSGIGKSFCLQLAKKNQNIILISRNHQKLNKFSEELKNEFNIQTIVICENLEDLSSLNRIHETFATLNLKISLLINNAAFGYCGNFESKETSEHIRMINANVSILTGLTSIFLKYASEGSRVINISSQACFQPIPYFCVYAATKAYVHSFSLGLYEEWKNKGIYVQTLIPGPTQSSFELRANTPTTVNSLKKQNPDEPVRKSLEMINSWQPVVYSIHGTWKQRLFAFAFPTKYVLKIVGKLFKHENNEIVN